MAKKKERCLLIKSLLSLWRSELKESTKGTYEQCLRDFVRFSRKENEVEAVDDLLRGDMKEIEIVLEAFLWDIHGRRGLRNATANTRLRGMRSLLKLAVRKGLILAVPEVKGLPSENSRESFRSILREEVDSVLFAMSNGKPLLDAARNVAIFWLMYEKGLRRSEVEELNYEDLRGEMDALPLHTCGAIVRWIEFRGDHNGPLFFSVSKRNRGQGRLSGHAIYQVIRNAFRAIGVRICPKLLRWGLCYA
jgi:site-specific recombinase XerD